MPASLKFPLIFSGVVFVIILVSSLLMFNIANNTGVNCVDIIGDGYAMGLDEEPVVIGTNCETPRYMTPRLAIAVAALGAIVSWGVIRVLTRKTLSTIRKISFFALIIAVSTIVFVLTMFIISLLSGGIVVIEEANADLVPILLIGCSMVSIASSYFIVNLVFTPKASR